MTINTLLENLKNDPKSITFNDVIDVIEENYSFTETAFKNGDSQNESGQNSGSCKIFSFAKLNKLSKEETLACFGAYYFDEVLNYPESDNHQNIRQFMIHGWGGIKFDSSALEKK